MGKKGTSAGDTGSSELKQSLPLVAPSLASTCRQAHHTRTRKTPSSALSPPRKSSYHAGLLHWWRIRLLSSQAVCWPATPVPSHHQVTIPHEDPRNRRQRRSQGPLRSKSSWAHRS
ncbi:hypothetical protein M405DRAFT_417485 [Rhizopogon salebrosus TDB-379]|nr:hypothetical protein M405DRAFT_417485 [Rhizopogon salebrosus TDB-379]